MQYGEHWGGPSSPPGGFITNIDAMVALSTPEDSGPGFWSDAQQLEICNFGEGNEFVDLASSDLTDDDVKLLVKMLEDAEAASKERLRLAQVAFKISEKIFSFPGINFLMSFYLTFFCQVFFLK